MTRLQGYWVAISVSQIAIAVAGLSAWLNVLVVLLLGAELNNVFGRRPRDRIKPATALPFLCRLRGHDWRPAAFGSGCWSRMTCSKCRPLR